MLQFPTKADLDRLLVKIDEIGRGFDPVEYGLPIFDEASMVTMREVIIDWMQQAILEWADTIGQDEEVTDEQQPRDQD